MKTLCIFYPCVQNERTGCAYSIAVCKMNVEVTIINETGDDVCSLHFCRIQSESCGIDLAADVDACAICGKRERAVVYAPVQVLHELRGRLDQVGIGRGVWCAMQAQQTENVLCG